MRRSNPLARIRSEETDCRFCLAGAVVLAVAAAAVGYGLATGDTVTALGALVLVPAGGLLVGVGLSGSAEDERESGRRGAA